MERQREVNVDTNSQPLRQPAPHRETPSDKEVHVKKMTPADVKGASEKNKTVEEEAPALNEEQAP